MRFRALGWLALAAAALAGCRAGEPIIASDAAEPFTPPQWHRLDSDVCRRSSADPAEFEHCMAQFARLGPTNTAAETLPAPSPEALSGSSMPP